MGYRRLASGLLAEVAIAIKKATKPTGAEPVFIFDDASGRSIDLDLRGTEQEILARLPHSALDPVKWRLNRRHRSRAAAVGPGSVSLPAR